MNTSMKPNTGRVMPLLMNYTPSTRIEEMNEVKIVYNDKLQITEYEARMIGTKCLKTSTTWIKKTAGVNKTDRKNEIDDQKWVK